MFRRILLASTVLSLTAGCGFITISKSGSTAERYANYEEDLGGSLITFDPLPSPPKAGTSYNGESVASIDADLAGAISRYVASNEAEHFFNGFTILVYSGVDRELAFKTRNKLYSDFQSINTFMQYQQPRYLVKVGKYVNRIEALAWYTKIKDEFPSARIIQDRFERNTGNQNQENIENAQE